jgi:hypothetical protein
MERDRGDWFKFLAAGDRLAQQAAQRFETISATYPDAKLIVSGVRHVMPEGSKNWLRESVPAQYAPEMSMAGAALRGNIWHSLSAMWIRRDALEDGFDFAEGALSFASDMLFAADLSRRMPTLFVPDILVERVLKHRKTFTAKVDSTEAISEEATVRYRCADWLYELVGDKGRYERMRMAIDDWVIGRLGMH